MAAALFSSLSAPVRPCSRMIGSRASRRIASAGDVDRDESSVQQLSTVNVKSTQEAFNASSAERRLKQSKDSSKAAGDWSMH